MTTQRTLEERAGLEIAILPHVSLPVGAVAAPAEPDASVPAPASAFDGLCSLALYSHQPPISQRTSLSLPLSLFPSEESN